MSAAIATYGQTGRTLSVTTPLGKDALLLTGFKGTEGLSQLFRFELDLVAENRADVSFDELLGQRITVELTSPGGKKRCFNGIVNRFSQGPRDATFTSYRAEVVPSFWLWTKKVQCRIFQHLSVPDILKRVLEGLDVTYEIQGTFHPRNYCVQYRESDFAFASRLMEEEGIYYFFKHGAVGHQMVVANTPYSHPDVPGNSRTIYEEMEGGVRNEPRVTSWEKAQGLRAGKFTLWDHSFELPGKHLEATKAILGSVSAGRVTHQLNGINQELEVYEYPGGYAQRFDGIDRGGAERPADLQKIFEDARRTAEIRMQQEAVNAVQVRGESNCGHFVAGHKFTLERHFNADGPYVLTHVEHSAECSADYRSGSGAGLIYKNRFTCIPAALPFRPQRATPRPVIQGPQTAVVVGPSGETIFCDKYGRVKVQFHWDRQGKSDADSSCWIRVSSVGAGKGFGFVNLPRIGQEVIVDFIEGDPDRPIITGAVYNAEDMPPRKLPECRTQFGLRGFDVVAGGNQAEAVVEPEPISERRQTGFQRDCVLPDEDGAPCDEVFSEPEQGGAETGRDQSQGGPQEVRDSPDDKHKDLDHKLVEGTPRDPIREVDEKVRKDVEKMKVPREAGQPPAPGHLMV